jgi:hypothetical protein
MLFYSGSTYQDNLEPDQLSAPLGAIAQNRTQAVVSTRKLPSMFSIMESRSNILLDYIFWTPLSM